MGGSLPRAVCNGGSPGPPAALGELLVPCPATGSPSFSPGPTEAGTATVLVAASGELSSLNLPLASECRQPFREVPGAITSRHSCLAKVLDLVKCRLES